MDSSLQSANIAVDGSSTSLDHHAEIAGAEEEHHIHLPNPSWWPMILGAAILVAVTGLLFLPDNPWLTIIAAPFVLLGIMGWALENPMAAPKEQFVSPVEAEGTQSRFYIGQDVVDRNGERVGSVEARFSHYILVNIGGLVRPAYIPHSLIETVNGASQIQLNITASDVRERGLQNVPENLYDDAPEYGMPIVNGVPMFARGPLSPAETGHYNYGPNFPGINTDAAGSYRPEEVRPIPQKYVSERRNIYANRKPAAPKVATSN
jgi:Cytochrome c oxidase subunit IV